MLLFVLPAFPQIEEPAELYYEMNSIHRRTISQKELKTVNTLSDINDRYPSKWMKEYISVEVSAMCDGTLKSVMGEGEKLNDAQKDLLQSADCNADVSVVVKYMPDNNLKHNDVQIFDFSYYILPENNATFSGGNEKMEQYLKEQITDKISGSIPVKDINWSAVRFSINADGSINNINQIGSSNYESVDKIIMDAICGMPQWIPAKDANGVIIQQDFEFVLGNTAKICGLNHYFAHDYFLE